MTPDQEEITKELATLLHEVGFTSEEAFAGQPARLVVVIPKRRAVLIAQPTGYVMVLTNDALGAHLTGERWLHLARALKHLEVSEAEAHEVAQL